MERCWWYKKWGHNNTCGITRARLRPGVSKDGTPHTTHLACGHSFYTKPLNEWIKNCPSYPPTCPSCRQEFNSESY